MLWCLGHSTLDVVFSQEDAVFAGMNKLLTVNYTTVLPRGKLSVLEY